MSGWETARKALALVFVFLAGAAAEVPPGLIQQYGSGWILVYVVVTVLFALGLLFYDE
jgi:hypothetical protein